MDTDHRIARLATLLLETGYRRRPMPRLGHAWSKPDGTRAYGYDIYIALRPHLDPLDPMRLYGFSYTELAAISQAADAQAIPACP